MIINAFSKQNRNAGTYNFGPVAFPQGANFIEARGLMNASDIIDPTLTLTWMLEVSYGNQSGPWVFFIGGGWQGGLDSEGNPVGAPNQTWQTTGQMPSFLRGEITLSQRVNLGLEIEILTK